MTITGNVFADISSNNGAVDYERYAAAPETAPLIAIKATEGTAYTWTEGRDASKRAHAAGLAVAHYHFARGGSAIGEMDRFLPEAQGRFSKRHGDFLVLDVEVGDPHDMARWTSAADRYLAKRNHRAVLYTYRSFLIEAGPTFGVAGGLVWLADYTTPHTSLVKEWNTAAWGARCGRSLYAHQHTDHATIPGVADAGQTDSSVLRAASVRYLTNLHKALR